jgi:hypothetical protein
MIVRKDGVVEGLSEPPFIRTVWSPLPIVEGSVVVDKMRPFPILAFLERVQGGDENFPTLFTDKLEDGIVFDTQEEVETWIEQNDLVDWFHPVCFEGYEV